MPRRISDYPDAYTGWNIVSSLGSIVSVVASYVFLDIVYKQLTIGNFANRDPWHTPEYNTDTLQHSLARNYTSIEWGLMSPPKPHAFTSLPKQSSAFRPTNVLNRPNRRNITGENFYNHTQIVIKSEQLQHLIEHPTENPANDKALAQTLYREANELSSNIQDRTDDSKGNPINNEIDNSAINILVNMDNMLMSKGWSVNQDEESDGSSTLKNDISDDENDSDSSEENGQGGNPPSTGSGSGPSTGSGSGPLTGSGSAPSQGGSSETSNSYEASDPKDSTLILDLIIKIIKAICGDDDDYMD
jgi:hypothetical protein